MPTEPKIILSERVVLTFIYTTAWNENLSCGGEEKREYRFGFYHKTSKKWDIQWLVSFTLWVLYKPQTHNYSYENAQCNLGSKEGIELKGVCDIITGVLFLVMDVLEEKNR